jgi:hypothetical protein
MLGLPVMELFIVFILKTVIASILVKKAAMQQRYPGRTERRNDEQPE